jgi:AraC-like DNA-binding protein
MRTLRQCYCWAVTKNFTPSITANHIGDFLEEASTWINKNRTAQRVSRFPAADYPLLATRSLNYRNRIAVIPSLRHGRPMQCSISATFGDADALQAAMQAVGLLRLATTQKGRFRAAFSQVMPDRLQLIAVEESLPRIAFVRVPLDRILVAFTPERLSCQLWNGMRTDAEHLVVLDSGASAHVRTDGPSRWRAICLPKPALARYAHALTGGILRMPEGVSFWHSRPAALRELHAMHVETMRSMRIVSDTLATPEGGHGLEQQLIHALVECLSESTSKFPVGDYRVMASFEELLLAEPNRAWSVADVRRMLGMSDRFIRQSCQACVGMSPQSFLRLLRLHAVHRALRHPASSSTSVSQVGQQRGFRHPGRLAVAYRTLFGESPSHTLRQGRFGALPPLRLPRPTIAS